MNILDLKTLDGRPFTLLLMGTTPEGEDDWAVFSGVARPQDGTLHIDRGTEPSFEIKLEWIDRIRPVDRELRSMLLDADYFLSLTIGRLSVDDDGNDLLQTGLQWPD